MSHSRSSDRESQSKNYNNTNQALVQRNFRCKVEIMDEDTVVIILLYRNMFSHVGVKGSTSVQIHNLFILHSDFGIELHRVSKTKTRPDNIQLALHLKDLLLIIENILTLRL
jgi:hypothetical protein